MKDQTLLGITFLSIVIVGVLHQIGSLFYFYWSVTWFDSLMHFLGGLSMGLLFIWGWYVSGIFGKKPLPSKHRVMINTLVLVVCIGVGWEIFEHLFDIADPTRGNYLEDTTHDMIADISGGIVAGIIGRVQKFYA